MKLYTNVVHRIVAVEGDAAIPEGLTEHDVADVPFFEGMSSFKMRCYCYKADENGVQIYPAIEPSLIAALDAQNTVAAQHDLLLLDSDFRLLLLEQERKGEMA